MGWQRIEYSIWIWTQIFGQNPQTDVDAIFRIHTSLWCPPPLHSLCDVAPSSVVGWYKMCSTADSRFFSRIRRLASVIMSIPIAKNSKFAFAQKTFQTCIPSTHESVSALLSDGYITIQWPSLSEVTTIVIHCVRFKISWQLTEKGDRWQDMI